MIGRFIYYKLRMYLSGWRNPGTILLHIFLIILFGLYAAMFGYMGNAIYAAKFEGMSFDQFILSGWLIIFGFTLLRAIFPSYTPHKSLFPAYYPITPWKRYLASVIDGFVTPFFFYVLMALVVVVIFLDHYQIPFLLTGLGVMISTHLLRRSLQYAIDYRLRPIGYGLLLIVVAVLVVLGSNYSCSTGIFGFELLVVPAGLLLAGFYQEKAVLGKQQKRLPSFSLLPGKNYYLKLITNNPKARILLPLAIGFKGILLAGLMGIFKEFSPELSSMSGEEGILIWALATPFMLFGYLYNNIWAFWPDAWRNIELRAGGFSQVLQLQLKLLMIPLIIDFIITISLLFPFYDDWFFVLVFYMGFTFYLVFASVFWSLFTPVKVKAAFQATRGNCSTFSAIVSMVALFLLVLIKSIGWVYYFMPIYVIAGGIGVWLARDSYEEKKYGLIRKLKI
ncbi:MAG: hypothetical protein K9I68_11235 [Bacteroidales bacterium]|nr:hypothetical protein [Bacteroidales bacterium]MCF8338038.1 hypothetical protein [Bacteroidales bacterium]